MKSTSQKWPSRMQSCISIKFHNEAEVVQLMQREANTASRGPRQAVPGGMLTSAWHWGKLQLSQRRYLADGSNAAPVVESIVNQLDTPWSGYFARNRLTKTTL